MRRRRLLLLLLLLLLSGRHGCAGWFSPDPEPELADLVSDLCGDSCSDIVERSGLQSCRLTFGQGCPNDEPPTGFSKASTLWEMCPLSCPAAEKPSDSSKQQKEQDSDGDGNGDDDDDDDDDDNDRIAVDGEDEDEFVDDPEDEVDDEDAPELWQLGREELKDKGGSVTQYGGPTECDDSGRVKMGQLVSVTYTATIDKTSSTVSVRGRQFQFTDSEPGKPADLHLGKGTVIPGLEKGLDGLCHKAKAVIVVPPELGCVL
eukprot:COSAG05_NODE_3349_length_2133_cov_6.365591_3_plen_260_part_00